MSSLLAKIIWIPAIALPAAAGYVVYDLHTAMQAQVSDAAEAFKVFKPKTEEGWRDLESNDDRRLVFKQIRLVPGEKESLAPAKGPDAGPGPDKPVGPPPVNIAAEAEKLRKAFTDQYALNYAMRIIGSDDMRMLNSAHFTVLGGGKGVAPYAFTLQEGDLLATSAFIDVAAFSNVTLKDWRLAQVLETSVVVHVTTPAFQEQLRKAREKNPEEVKKHVTDDDRVVVVLEYSDQVKKDEDRNLDDEWRAVFGDSKAKDKDAPKGPATPEIKSDPLAIKPGDLAPKPEEKPQDWPSDSFLDPEGNFVIGTVDLVPGNENSADGYVETYLDPSTRQPAGIKVKDNLPMDQSNMLRRAGFSSGDVVKSINSQRVENMQQVRKVVTEMRNAGETNFVVVFERNGAEQTKTFKAPKKKGVPEKAAAPAKPAPAPAR